MVDLSSHELVYVKPKYIYKGPGEKTTTIKVKYLMFLKMANR